MSPDWKLGFHQGSSLARETYGGLAPLVLFRAFHAVAKAIVSEDRDGLHSIGDHDVWIVNLDEVVAFPCSPRAAMFDHPVNTTGFYGSG